MLHDLILCVHFVRTHLFVLIGRDGDELRLFEGNVGNEAVARADAHDVKLRLVLMEGVQHDLKVWREKHIHVPSHLLTLAYIPVHMSKHKLQFLNDDSNN